MHTLHGGRNHARHQPTHREQLGVQCLAQGHFDINSEGVELKLSSGMYSDRLPQGGMNMPWLHAIKGTVTSSYKAWWRPYQISNFCIVMCRCIKMATDWLVEQRWTGLDKKVWSFQKELPVENLFSKAQTRQRVKLSVCLYQTINKSFMIHYHTVPTDKLMSYMIQGRPSGWGWDTQLK